VFAIGAVLAFAIALLLNLIGGKSGSYWLDFALAGGLLVAAHLVWGGWRPWERPHP